MNGITTTIVLISAIALVGISTQNVSAGSQTDPTKDPVPDWVNNNFVWYGQGQISQTDLLNSLKFLLDKNIMFISEDAKIEVQQLREENLKLKALIGVDPPVDPEVKLDPVPGALPELPGFCPDIYEPVCGVDGKTYDNKCEADKAKVEIDYREECKVRPDVSCPSGYIWLDCAQVCIPHDGNFVCPDGYSWSEHSMSCTDATPDVCPRNYDPVCGVNGKTYGNMCEAENAGVEIEYKGECSASCRSNDDCSSGDVCIENFCQRPCQIQCLTYDPVCGIDGQTYACGVEDAKCHGVEIAYEGECRGNEIMCTAVYDPVCGTDGKTYGNQCEADKARVTTAYTGECRRTP